MAWAMKRMSTQKAASDKEKPTDASIDERLKSQKSTVKDANDSDVVSMLCTVESKWPIVTAPMKNKLKKNDDLLDITTNFVPKMGVTMTNKKG
jgi:hypothetical protein